MAKIKLAKEDKIDLLVDVLALQEMAKHIWGNEILVPDDFGMSLYNWQYHLGRLVIAKDPKKYLKKFIK